MVRSRIVSLVQLVSRMSGPEVPDAELLRCFVSHREQEAFAALVQRHGRLVWGVCRHLLQREHDAEDAFQATFLVLARRAASIRQSDSVGSWLYGVAYRVARKAKVAAAKRAVRERRAAVTEETSDKDLAWRELQAILDDELTSLPEKYRAPFVLCCLEGRSRKEAEAELCWKEGTVSSRIAQARRLLESRLARRGVSLSAALVAKTLWERTASAAVPAALTEAVGRGEAVTAAAAALARGMLGGNSMRVLAGMIVVALGMTAVAVTYGGLSAKPAIVAEAESPAMRPGVDLNGNPLPPGAITRLGTTRFRHGDLIRSMAFTPDGKLLVASGGDGVRVWDAATGREVFHLPKSFVGILSKDGKRVVTAERGKNGETLVRVRSRSDFKVIREFDAGQNFQSPRLSPDGRLLASTIQKHSKSYFVEIWDLESGKRLHSWEAHQGSIHCHDFTPDGKRLVTGGEGVVRFWDVATAALAREIAHPSVVSKLAMSPDGASLATTSMTAKRGGGGVTYFPWDNVLRVWDVGSGKMTRHFDLPAIVDSRGFTKGFSALTFSPDSKMLLSGGVDGMLRFWDLTNGKQSRQVEIGAAWLLNLVFSNDGKSLAVGSSAIRILDAATGKDMVNLVGGGTAVFSAIVTPNGQTVATSGQGSIHMWDSATGRELGRIGSLEDSYSTPVFLPDGRTMLAMRGEKALGVIHAATAKEIRRVHLENGTGELLAVSPDGRTALRRGKEPTSLILIDVLTGKELDNWKEIGDSISGAMFAPGGQTLIIWRDDHFANVFDLKTRKKVRQFEFHNAPVTKHRPVPVGGMAGRRDESYGAALSPDGRLLVYGSQQGYLALHDVATGQCVRVIDKLGDGPCFFAFTPDGRTLAWGGWNEPRIHLTEVATGQERLRLDGHKGRIYSLQFAADGNTLVSSSQDGTGLVWDAFGRSGAKAVLSAKELDACWADLAGDAARAFQAMHRLLRSPAEAIPYLAKRLRPVPKRDAKRLADWVADLDSVEFGRRKAATVALEGLGDVAEEVLRKALQGEPSLESRKRLEKLLAAIDSAEKDPSAERLRTLRCLEVLERAGPSARETLEALAAGAPGSWLTREAEGSRKRATR